MAEKLTADEVLGYLGEASYPADKDALMAAAQQAGAPDYVLKAVRAVPPVDYANRDELVRSLRLDPAPHRSDSEAAAQAHTGAPSGVAQSERAPQQDRVKGAERRS